MRALANEIAKNLVLAGIGSLTVLDSSIVTDDDLGAQFFISEQDIGHNVCRADFRILENYYTDKFLARRSSGTSNTKA